MIENWAHGKGIFLINFDSLPGSVSVAAAGLDFVILPVAETRWPPRRGVSSSGMVGVVTVMIICSVEGSYKKRWGRESGGERLNMRARCHVRVFEGIRSCRLLVRSMEASIEIRPDGSPWLDPRLSLVHL